MGDGVWPQCMVIQKTQVRNSAFSTEMPLLTHTNPTILRSILTYRERCGAPFPGPSFTCGVNCAWNTDAAEGGSWVAHCAQPERVN